MNEQQKKRTGKCAYLCGPHLEPCNRRKYHEGFCYHLDPEQDSEIPCIAAVAREQAEMEEWPGLLEMNK